MDRAEITFAGESKNGDVPITFRSFKGTINYKLAKKICQMRKIEYSPEFIEWFTTFRSENSDLLGDLLNTNEKLFELVIQKIIQKAMLI